MNRKSLARRRKLCRILACVFCMLLCSTALTGVALGTCAKSILANPRGVLARESVEVDVRTIAIEEPKAAEQTLAQAKLSSTSLEIGSDPGWAYNSNLFNLVLLGIDSDNDREQNDAGYRSDTMVVCAIDLENETIDAVTIPRDTKATMHLYDESGDGSYLREYTYRLNSAFEFAFCAREPLAYQNALDAIQTLFAAHTGLTVPLQYSLGIDMDGIGPLATAVGGVPVQLDATIEGVGAMGETIFLKGETAKLYVRTRKGEGLTGSDLDRANRQQLFFLGVGKQLKNIGIAGVPSLYTSVSGFMDTNLTLDQMIALAGLLSDMEIDTDITFHTLEGEYVTEDGQAMYIADEDAMEELIREIWYVKSADAA